MELTESNVKQAHDVLVVLARTEEAPCPPERYVNVLKAAFATTHADQALFVILPHAQAWVEPIVQALQSKAHLEPSAVSIVLERDLYTDLERRGEKNAYFVLMDTLEIPRALAQKPKYLLDPRALYTSGPTKVDLQGPWPANTKLTALTNDTPAWTRHFTEIPRLRERLALVRTIIKHQGEPGVPRTLLITGDTGTGKSYLAKCLPAILHTSFDDGRKEFSLTRNGETPSDACQYTFGNCASLSENLADALLFGAVKGAYTGCDADRKGLLESAGNGILFLDEVGELPLGTQSKLLTVLEERKFYRLGDTGPKAERKDLNCFIIFGTNVELEQAVITCEQTRGEKGFRRDLLNRINTFTLHLPSLYERLHGNATSSEITELGAVFLDDLIVRSSQLFSLTLTDNAVQAFKDFAIQAPWEGNYRDVRSIFQILRVKTIAHGLGSVIPAYLMQETLNDWSTANRVTSFRLKALRQGLPLNEQIDLERIFEACGRATSCADAGRAYYGELKKGNISDLFKKHLASRGLKFDLEAPNHLREIDEH